MWCETIKVLEMKYPFALPIDLLSTTLFKYSITLNEWFCNYFCFKRKVKRYRMLYCNLKWMHCVNLWSVQFSSVGQSCPTLCDTMNHSTPSFPVHHQLLELAQTHVQWVGDAIQPSHPLSSPSSPALNLSQPQGLFPLVTSLHHMPKVLELQHQSFQCIFSTDFL